jgi:hypothetical protein
MATKPKPVPWEDVVDLCGDLFEWLVENGHASKGDYRATAAGHTLAKAAPGDALVRAVAHSLLILDGYVSAGKRQDMPGLFANSRIPKNVQELLFSDAIEEEADRDIRDLSPRLAQIRRLIGKIAERNTRRQVLSHHTLSLCEEDRKRKQAILEGVLAGLQRVEEATKELYRSFQQFNPAATRYPLTLAGWLQFKKEIRGDLTKLGFLWPK